MLAITMAVGALLMTTAPAAPTDDVKQRLQAIAGSTVLFGHQSVGVNVLDGLRALARGEGIDLRIEEVQSAKGLQPGTFGHVFVATNGDPRRKLTSFTTALDGGDPDVALVKLCFVDFDASTDVRELFSAYRSTLLDLQAKHPRTTFVHVTVPLQAGEGILRSLAKRLLGRTSSVVPSNARREEFNALLRSTYRGEPLFDIAQLESTDSSGHSVSAQLDGKSVPMLALEYTDDGGHLNAEGSWRAALGLVDALGEALASRPKAAAPARLNSP